MNLKLIPMEVRDTSHEDFDMFTAFIECTDGYNYGEQETLDAWEWFSTGYKAAQASVGDWGRC